MTIKFYELCGADTSHLFSPHCWKTRYSFAHKGLDYETIPVPFTGVASLEGGTDRRVPVIRDGDAVVEDSLEIAVYLDEKYPKLPSLLGGDASLSLTRFIVSWSQSQLHPEVAKICILDIHNSLAPADQEFFRASREKMFGCTLEEFSAKFPKDAVALNKVLVPLHILLKDQDYIGGSSPMFSDYVIFGALQWLRLCSTTDITIDGRVGDWFDRLLDMYDGLGRRSVRPS